MPDSIGPDLQQGDPVAIYNGSYTTATTEEVEPLLVALIGQVP